MAICFMNDAVLSLSFLTSAPSHKWNSLCTKQELSKIDYSLMGIKVEVEIVASRRRYVRDAQNERLHQEFYFFYFLLFLLLLVSYACTVYSVLIYEGHRQQLEMINYRATLLHVP